MTARQWVQIVVLMALLAAACFGQVSINANPVLDGAAVGAPYSVNLFAAGGTPPYTFTQISGTIPGGLNLSAAGILSGTPTAAGPANFTVMVQDANGASAVKAFTLPISAAPLTLAPASGSLPTATVGQFYQQNFTASGGSGSYTYLLIPSTPTQVNLDLDPQSGLFYGTPFNALSTSMIVEVVDSERRKVSQSYSLNIVPANKLTINSCASLPPITPGATYSAQLIASGGFIPYSFVFPLSALPPGITIAEDGTIRGILPPFFVSQVSSAQPESDGPGKSVVFPGLFLQGLTVVDGAGNTASVNCVLSVNIPDTPTITTSSPLPGAVVNTPYQVLIQTGSPFPQYTFSASGLPPGLVIGTDGTISGKPTATGTFTFVVSGSLSGAATIQKSFTLTVASQPLTITTATPLPPATLSRFYSQSILASESPTGSLIWLSGTLPEGMTFIGQQALGKSFSSQLIGTPYKTGTFTFTVELDHSDGRIAQKTFTLVVNEPSLAITAPSPLPVGFVGASYQKILQASPTGGSPYSWQVTQGTLPSPLTLDGGGLLSGFPGSSFNNTFTALVLGDANSRALKDLQLIVRAQALTISTPSVPGAVMGRPYSASILAIGGAGPPYQYSVTPTLPPGITFSNGTFSGTPATTGPFGFTVTATDSDGSVATRSYSLTVFGPLTLTPVPLPSGVVGKAYPPTTLTATGGIPPYFFTVPSGLPPGLNISRTGVISGTPTAAGPFTFNVQVSDTTEQAVTAPFQIVINPQLVVNPATLPSGVVNKAYPGASLTATGGVGPFTWTLVSGSTLPPGLTLSPAGAISGTPTSNGPFTFMAQVADQSSQTATGQFQIVINTLLSVVPATLPTGVVSKAYPGASLSAIGGVGPFTWTAPATALPPGLTLSPAGVISGTPTANGPFPFTATVADQSGQTATGQFQIVVNSLLTVVPATLPSGVVSKVYPGATLTVTGGVGPFTWTTTPSTLPPGLTLSTAGVISGTPTANGPFPFSVQVSDQSGQTATGQFQIVVNTLLTVLPASLPVGIVSKVYPGATLTATGGVGSFTWTTTGSTLPPGLTLSSAGVISGTPTSNGPFPFIAQVADQGGQTTTGQFQIVINSLLTVVPATLPVGIVSKAYPGASLTATGGVGPYSWSVTGSTLPPGLTLSPGGVISGTPTVNGTFPFTVQAADQSGQTATAPMQIVVNSLLTATLSALPVGIVSKVYPGATLNATGGVGPYAWTITGATLPPGLTLSSTGAISGTPTANGPFSFTAQVSDQSGQTATGQFQIVVNTLLVVVQAALPSVTINAPYGPTALNAMGGVLPYTWTVAGGVLPQGLTLSPAGVITGTPIGSGTSLFTAQVSDSSGQTATGQFQIVVNSLLTVIQTLLPPTTVNVPYSPNTLNALGGVPPYSWTVSGGGLPPGISLNSSGVLSGTATATGSFSFTVQVSDKSNQTATGQFLISVNQQSRITPNSVPAGTVNVAYPAVTFTVDTGGSFNWSAGGLPPGLTLAPTGVLMGTPTQDGIFTFTVTASGQSGSASTTITMRVFPVIGLGGIPIAPIDPNTPVQITLTGTGGTPPYSFTLNGCAVPGLSLSSGGTLSGTATTPGTFNCSVQVADSSGASSTTPVTITVLPLLTIAGNLPAGVLNQTYGPGTLTATGGKPPYAFTVSAGALPGGLTLSTSGNISGTPTAAGTFSFTGKVSDAGGASASGQFTITVTAGLAITTAQLPDGTVNVVYPPVTLASAGGTKPFVWSASGSVPPGLSLSPDGVFGGIPTQLGTFTFAIRVTDAAQTSASATFTVRVVATTLVISANLPAAVAGTAYSQTATATGGSGTLTWSVASGTLPPGLSFSPGGTLSGTPTANGSFNFVIQVTDSAQPPQSATQAVTLVVNLPPSPPAQVGGLPDVIDAAQQPKFSLTLGTAFPVDIAGTLTLTFKSSAVVPADDPAIKFMNGLRTLDFTIPANQTTAVFAVPALFSTGTVAGTITVTAVLRAGQTDVTPSPAPVRSVVVNAAPPVITSVTAASSSGGVTVTVQGFATTRQVTQAKFHFTPSGAGTLQTSDITVDVTSVFTQWYQSAASMAFGSGFSYVQPFTFQGSFTGSVSVTLVNDKGTSSAVSAQF